MSGIVGNGFMGRKQGVLPYTPPLDGNNASYAGGFRKLRTDYTGFCCQVAWVGGTALNVGFKSDGEIDDAAILSVKGASTVCQLRNLYNQAASGNYQQINSGLQPIIYKDGDFVRNSAGKIAFSTDETTQRYLNGTVSTLEYLNGVGHVNMYVYGKIKQPKATGSNQGIWSFTTPTGFARNEIIPNLTAAGKINYGGRRLDGEGFQSIVSTNEWPANDFLFSGNSEYANAYIQMYFNNVLEASSSSFHSAGNISATDSNRTDITARFSVSMLPCRGEYSEFILWTNDQSANYASIRNNIIDYYS